MEAIHVIMAMIVGLGGLMMFLFGTVSDRFTSIGARLDKIQETITDIDRRLCRLEGAFASKECCMIKDHRHKEDSA